MNPGLSSEALKHAQTTYEQVSTFSMSGPVQAAERELNLPTEYVERCAREFRKWITLNIVNPGKNYTMMGRADSIWHNFILYTEDYAEFCDKVAGRFIHHQPAPSDNIEPIQVSPGTKRITLEKVIGEHAMEGYANTLADLEAYFGEDIDHEIWPVIKDKDGGLINASYSCPEQKVGVPIACCGGGCGCVRVHNPGG
jgi:hypothetical protein